MKKRMTNGCVVAKQKKTIYLSEVNFDIENTYRHKLAIFI